MENHRGGLSGRMKKILLYGIGGAIVVGGAILALASPDRATAEVGSFLRDGKAGFVVTRFAYALGPDAAGTAQCGGGVTLTTEQIYAGSQAGQKRPGESDEAYGQRIKQESRAISSSPSGEDYCLHPELAPFDPHTRILRSAAATAEGMNLDGRISRSRTDAKSGRLDFRGADGTEGIDNQFRRAVGCNTGYQSSGLANGFQTEMYTGSWGILVRLDDVGDLTNDDHVEVVIAANADPIRVSPSREALEYATYALDPDERFVARTTGRIRNGVLHTDPVDVRFHNVVNAMHLERPLRDAVIRARLSPDGVLAGYLGGYAPVEELYNYQFGYRNGKNADGTLADLGRRVGSANGAAGALGHTCPGIYQSLNSLADGHPRNGKYTSISTQYTFEARPAFVVDSAEADRDAVTS
ncbi:hypothetical protein [Croceicoccus hydrothermalis]|uniref:hypothetical protein n=1 Tax=Croceicoccus hydrothermalis TaxID=2867964 RepID=UPI001EFC1B65|nr:hypothetical protein [Croceicoccus hydrothermalis]